MALTVSPPVRIAALVGLLAALGLGGMFMLMGHKSGSTAAPPVHITHHPFGPGAAKHTSPAKAVPATKISAKGAHVKTAVTSAPVAHKAPERPSAEIAALNAGLPGALARALAQHDVVVVELTDPQSEVDGIAFAEARAGAMDAGVGFVPLNVLSQADVGKLTTQFGEVLPDPGLLIYKRPASLVVRINGFVDKDTVAQAAHNAATGT